MTANLYLHSENLKFNGIDSFEDIKQKLNIFASDMTSVVNEHNQENIFHVSDNVFSVNVFDGKTIFEILSDCVQRDEYNIMLSILTNTSHSYNEMTLDDLDKMCFYQQGEEQVNSAVVLNRPLLHKQTKEEIEEKKNKHQAVHKDYITFDKYEVVYDRNTWLFLRRQILGNHPGSRKSFVDECRRCFPDLYFHAHCEESLIDNNYNYLETSPRKLVYYLSCVNDQLQDFISVDYKGDTSNPKQLLADFSGRYGLDEPGSLQQNHNKKAKLTFDFNYTGEDNSKKMTKVDVYCEPHFKISQPDSNYRGKVNFDIFHPRIYFSFSNKEIENGKILIGSIGEHVC